MAKFVYTFLLLLLFLYGGLFFLSFRGWGYVGYGGRYYARPSIWYWGGADYYPSRNVRTGTPGGGGMHQGK